MELARVFAYGSNLLTPRLRERTPSARTVTLARLEGHELRFHKRGSRDRSGKADAYRTGRARTWVRGVVWEISAAELPALDRAEGRGAGYERVEVAVQADGGAVEAFVYLAQTEAIDDRLRPFTWYRDLVVAGAREHGFPADYVEAIERVDTRPDPDRERARRMRALIPG